MHFYAQKDVTIAFSFLDDILFLYKTTDDNDVLNMNDGGVS